MSLGSFSQPLVGERFNGVGTWVKGEYTESASSPINFEASIQPTSQKDMLTLPEGRRDRETYRLYTDFELKTADEVSKVNADRVTIMGKIYEIIQVGIWRNNVIPHYKALASAVNV